MPRLVARQRGAIDRPGEGRRSEPYIDRSKASDCSEGGEGEVNSRKWGELFGRYLFGFKERLRGMNADRTRKVITFLRYAELYATPVRKNKGVTDFSVIPCFLSGGPSGVRTRVFAVRGRRPGPLDDGTGWLGSQGSNLETVGQSHV